MPRKAIKAGFVRAARKKKARSAKPKSNLEVIVENWLTEDEIPFRSQASVGKCHPDIMLGESTIVEINGCFWHGCKCQTPWTPKQKRARERDARRYHYFLARRFTVVIIWGCEISKKPSQARKRLREAARKAGL